jgi:hypothetical protein
VVSPNAELFPVNPKRRGMIIVDCDGIIEINDGRKDRTSAGDILEIQLNFSMPSSSHL